MSSRKYLVFVMIVVLLLAILAVNPAFGSESDKVPGEVHPPTCYRIESFAPGVLGLECFDRGADIIDVGVKSNAKYELTWNESSVTLFVYPVEKGATAFWYVADKNGSVTRGTLRLG